MNKAVFFDRDGVINRVIIKNGRPHPPSNLAEFELIPGIIDVINVLKKDGWFIAIVTNQPDVARGITSRSNIDQINNRIMEILPIDELSVCYHDDKDFCACRKPRPGMLLEIALKYKVSLEHSYLIGDRWKDIEAGVNAGCKTIFLDYSYAEKRPNNYRYIVKSVSEALTIIAGEKNDKN